MTSNAAATVAAPASSPRLRDRPWWPWARRALTAVFFGIVVWMLVSHARDIEWREVGAAMRRLPVQTLAIAALFAFASHLTYSTFDLFGRRAFGHDVPVPRVMAVTFTSYAFNLNLGSLVGGIAFRYRLYSKLGLDNGTITKVLGISMYTNWLGYLLLAGGVFAVDPPALPADWRIDQAALRIAGAVLFVLPFAYLTACKFAKKREWSVRGHEFRLPTLGFAAAQLAVSVVNWLFIAATIYTLMQLRIPFPNVLAVFLLSAVAALATHVPAGLGVLEAVFVALLASQLKQNELLGALLAYRAIYYLVPLAVAAAMYAWLEARTREKGAG